MKLLLFPVMLHLQKKKKKENRNWKYFPRQPLLIELVQYICGAACYIVYGNRRCFTYNMSQLLVITDCEDVPSDSSLW